MSAATKEAVELMEILPESEQNFALEFIKKAGNKNCCLPNVFE